MIKIKPVGILFMALEIKWTQKTFAGTGTDLAIQLGFLQAIGSTTILDLGNLSQAIHTMPTGFVKGYDAFILIAPRALPNSVFARHTFSHRLLVKLFLAHRLRRSRCIGIHDGLHVTTKQLLAHERGSLFIRHLTPFNATLQLEHLKERGIQFVIRMLVEHTGEVCLQLSVLCLQVSQLLLVVLLFQMTPPLLAVIHLTDHRLNLSGRIVHDVFSCHTLRCLEKSFRKQLPLPMLHLLHP